MFFTFSVCGFHSDEYDAFILGVGTTSGGKIRSTYSQSLKSSVTSYFIFTSLTFSTNGEP